MHSPQTFEPPRVLLSTIANPYGLVIVNDGAFQYAGKIPTRLNNRLVPVGGAEFIRELENSQGISAVLCTKNVAEKIPAGIGVAICESPLKTLYKIHTDLCNSNHHWGEPHESSFGSNVIIHPSASVAKHHVIIGDNVRIEENSIIRPHTMIGHNCVIGPGSIVGCEGFQSAKINGLQTVLAQAGGVIIGNNVTILALSTIARATFGGFTEIHDEVVIDNLVQVGHDVTVGKAVRIAAGSVISGRVEIGEGAYIAPNATVSNGLKIGSGATVSLGSVAIQKVKDGQTVTGNFAVPHKSFMSDLAKRFFS
jgi:UDP-3-O-[3-hydroxymyristoyl] glucosamine N-acyltransferase